MVKIEFNKKILDEYLEKVKPFIKIDILESNAKKYFTDKKINFILSATPDKFNQIIKETSNFSTTKMYFAFIGSNSKGNSKGNTNRLLA